MIDQKRLIIKKSSNMLTKYSRSLYLGGSLSRSMAIFGVQIIAVRLLGLDAYGSAMITLAPFVAIQLYIGTISAEIFSRRVALHNDQKKIEIMRKDFVETLRFELKLMIWFFVASFIIGTLLFGYFNSVFVALDDVSIILLPFFGLSTIFYQVLVQIYLIKSKLMRLSACYFLEATATPILVLILLSWDSSSNMLIFCFVLKNFLASFLLLIFFSKNWIAPTLASNSCMTTSYTMGVLPFQNLSLSIKTLWTNLDVVAVGFVSGSLAAGEFRIIKSLASIPSLLAGPWWNSIRSQMTQFFVSKELNSLIKLIKGTALQLSPLLILGLFFVFISDIFFKTVYLVEISFAFKIVFAIYFFGFVFANVITAWGRYLQVITGTLTHSLWINVYMVLIILVSVAINLYLVLPIPIPATIGFGLFTGALYYWYWLRCLRLEDI